MVDEPSQYVYETAFIEEVYQIGFIHNLRVKDECGSEFCVALLQSPL